jgi:hypothetical protein
MYVVRMLLKSLEKPMNKGAGRVRFSLIPQKSKDS